MKRKVVGSIVLAAIAISVFISSCGKDNTDPNTPTDARDKFVGTWTCQEHSSQNGNSTFTITVAKVTTNSGQIDINNFYNFGNQYKATCDVNTSTFTISPQVISSQTCSGNGASTGTNTFTMTYYVTNGSVTDTCTASCSH